jgi:hypothetical protein
VNERDVAAGAGDRRRPPPKLDVLYHQAVFDGQEIRYGKRRMKGRR